MPIYKVPPEAVWSSANVLVRAGFLQARPGLTQFVPTVMTGRPTGMFNSIMLATGAFQADAFQNDAFQTTGSLPSTLLLAGTTRKLYAFFGGVLNDVTGTTLTALETQPARFASIALGSPQTLFVLHTNGADAPRQWDATSATFTAVAGSPPLWSDFTNIAEHIVGIVPPYNIQWGNTQSISAWPAANVRVLSDTPDPLRAIAALGVRTGVVYKSRSLWDVVITGDPTESRFFRFEPRGLLDGPTGPAAVINTDGSHLYMTDAGRIGYYNGSRHLWVGDGIWPLIQANLDTTNTARIFGAYDPMFKIGVFCYPRTGDAGECKGWAIVMLPNIKEGYEGFITFHGSSLVALSAGGDTRLDSFKALFTRSDAGAQKVYTWEGVDDAGSAITGHWQTGMVGAPGLEFFTLEAYEAFVLRGGGFGTLTVKPVSSYILDIEGGTVAAAKTIDLAEQVVLGSPKGGDIRGRFFGMRFEFTTPITLKWLGSRLSALLRKG